MTYFPPPNLTATDEAGLLYQIKTYLSALHQSLNRAVGALESQAVVAPVVVSSSQSQTQDQSQPGPGFESLKALILRSADIVECYADAISRQLASSYVAKSSFGTYKEEISRQIEDTAALTKENIHSIRTILDTLDQVVSTRESHGVLRLGELETDQDGFPVVGLEVGQTRLQDGVQVFSKFARFTPQRLSFYDEHGQEAAWLSGQVLCIQKAQIHHQFQVGKFVTMVTGEGLVTRFIGAKEGNV